MIVDWKIWVEKRAYRIWEAEGRPEGRHEEFWYRAERDLAHENGKSSPRGARAAAPSSSGTAATAIKLRRPTHRGRKERIATAASRGQRVRSGGNQAKEKTQR